MLWIGTWNEHVKQFKRNREAKSYRPWELWKSSRGNLDINVARKYFALLNRKRVGWVFFFFFLPICHVFAVKVEKNENTLKMQFQTLYFDRFKRRVVSPFIRQSNAVSRKTSRESIRRAQRASFIENEAIDREREEKIRK